MNLHARPRPAWLLAVSLLALLAIPTASASRFDVACTDAEGDVAPGYDGIDIVGIESRTVGDVVEIRVTMAGDPGALVATHSLTVDYEGDEAPDLSYFDNGGGALGGQPVYWTAYPQAEGNDIVYPIEGNGFSVASLPGGKWDVKASAHSYGEGTVSDSAECASGSRGADGLGMALLTAGLVGVAIRRRKGA